MTEIFNKIWSKERRRELRNNATKAERVLWRYLKSRQLVGVIFRRQYNIGEYIADFYVPQLRLVIEVDGSVHFTPEAKAYDQHRTDYFSSLGLLTVRFTNDEVFNAIDSVISRLRSIVFFRQVHSPSYEEGVTGASRRHPGAKRLPSCASLFNNDTSRPSQS